MNSMDALVAAMHDLVVAAPTLLAGIPDPVVRLGGLEEWRVDPSDPTHFHRTTSHSPMIRGKAQAVLETSAEWGAAMDALCADPVLGPVVDQLVGSVLGASVVQGPSMVSWVLARALVADDPGATLRDVVSELRATYGSTTVTMTTNVIIGGVTAVESSAIADDVAVRPMTDDEVARALRVGAMPTLDVTSPLAWVPSRTCIAVSQTLPRVVGPIDAADEAMAALVARDGRVEAALATLRLAGFNALQEYARVTSDGRGGATWGARRGGPIYGPDVPFEPDGAAESRRLLAPVAHALGGRTPLAIAIRRFSNSHDPKHEEDRLLDLWIAVEALFGTDDPGETTFRVALNLANAIALPGMSRRAVFDWVKRSYALRSKLVHGRGVTFAKLKGLDGQPAASLSEVAEDLEAVVRQAILQRLAGPELDFIGLALGDGERTA